jgi:uracil phosphoribosyltransferase
VGSIRVVGAVAAPPALKRLSEDYPGAIFPEFSSYVVFTPSPLGLRVYVAMIDETVDEQGRIVPGLGDVAQRAFGQS